jgi:hypothetical protein
MSNELASNGINLDGFDDDGDDEGNFIRVIQGAKWTFSNEGVWVDGDGELIPTDREVVVVKLAKVLQKWLDQMPVRDCTKFLASGEQVDIEALNEECPRSEWSEDLNGKPRGPWQLQQIVYMVDMETMSKFTYATSTVGGNIAIGELKDAVKLMRKFRGPGVFPVVTIATKPMKTRFSPRPRPRPHLEIKRWISFGPDGTALPAASPALLHPSASPLAPQQDPDHLDKALQGAHLVEEPTPREQMNDDIPF